MASITSNSNKSQPSPCIVSSFSASKPLMLWIFVFLVVLTGPTFGFAPASVARKTCLACRAPIAMMLPVDPNDLHRIAQSIPNAIEHATSWLLSDEAVSVYSKVDKTGFIGFIATYIELCIDLFRQGFNGVGIVHGYGLAIIVFTIIVRILTVPLTTQQLASSTKLQRLTPLQQKIQAKYANDDETKNRLLAQLFQAAGANPLAGCLPALIQIPVFISLYRALTNLVAQNKLSEPFLWVPNLQGPVFSKPPSEAGQWLSSLFSGKPELGWSDTLAYLSLPIILYITQSISQKVLQPPRDPNRKVTDQEAFAQNLLIVIPLLAAFFCLNAPASLSVYWIVNSISATIATVAIKNSLPNDPLPKEVDEIMAMVDGGKQKNEAQEGRVDDTRPKPVGFSKPPTNLNSRPEVVTTQNERTKDESTKAIDGDETDSSADTNDGDDREPVSGNRGRSRKGRTRG